MAANFVDRTLAEWLRTAATELQANGIDTPQQDARLLAQAALGSSAAELLTLGERKLAPQELFALEHQHRRRCRREPVSRILGRRGFMNLELEISPATLDPRPDTETLVEAALTIVRQERRETESLAICDLGTGSGAILIALLQALPVATGLGLDLSAEAIAVASRNGTHYGLETRAVWQHGNWLHDLSGQYDLIVSNPPYIPSAEIAALEPEVSRYDPVIALDGGTDGLDAYRAIATLAPSHLKPAGWLILEVGWNQVDAVRDILAAVEPRWDQSDLQLFKDLTGHSRVVAKRHHVAVNCPRK